MQIRMEDRNQPLVSRPTIAIERFQQDTIARSCEWAQELRSKPDAFSDIEQQIDTHYRRGAGQLVASVLAQITESSSMDQHVQSVRKNAAVPLRSPQPRTVKIRLLCGLLLWVTTAEYVLENQHEDGFHLGEEWPHTKFSLWEKSTRVPFIIWDPRGQNGNRKTCAEPVGLINVYRTLCDLTGLGPPEYVDGMSLVPWLENPAKPKEKPAMTTWGRGNYTLPTKNWRYTRYFDGSEELSTTPKIRRGGPILPAIQNTTA